MQIENRPANPMATRQTELNCHRLARLAAYKMAKPTCSLLKRTIIRNALNILPPFSSTQEQNYHSQDTYSDWAKTLKFDAPPCSGPHRHQDRPHQRRRIVSEPDHKFLNFATMLPTAIESIQSLSHQHSQDTMPIMVTRRHSSPYKVQYSQPSKQVSVGSQLDWLSMLEEELGEHMQLPIPHFSFSFAKGNKLASITPSSLELYAVV